VLPWPRMTLTERRPRLAAKARLRFDRKAQRYMLLYPEKGLVLNTSATEILRLCTGEHTVDSIVDRLWTKFAGPSREEVAREVNQFLESMAARSLVLIES
jgi:pyrroloquinoline quinone biosynthesis protein D